ncbi:hypothetical protein KL905_004131 [Ogataea polymorpha]|nr:hypothetical protein KL937_003769 [Ogataea polymorpha]KAG7887526.1 hypothetical protein KL936_004223 [Ogataea polymorpha]KAG7890471.1 hypothetical protein KL908_004308 [Ogataea polymorpha]KAG7907345.1 hypothetical protein KL906_004032 [Ogataea polymorpha]KAG7918052.1 hypothetical protein KL905_004131 [Ogataea polymorpha]
MFARFKTVSSGLFERTIVQPQRTIIMGRLRPFAQKKKPTIPREERAKKSKRIVQLVKEAIENDEPHFTVGAKKLYFPSARVTLLRPNAKQTPYQAKFLVPKSFNKLDLRDYLYHLYGLRVLNVTVALTPAKWEYPIGPGFSSRHRVAQKKKMTVDMIDPFVWPEETEFFKNQAEFIEQRDAYREDKLEAVGSDKLKPSKAFEGIIDRHPQPMNFVPKIVERQMRNLKDKAMHQDKRLRTEEFISQHIQL